MRKSIVLVSVSLALVSCGKIESTAPNGGVGVQRTFVAGPANATQLSQMQALCTRLQQKDANYVYYVNGYSKFNYETSIRQCDGTATTAVVTPTLSNNGGLLQFALPPGQSLATSVETATSGQVSQLCRALSNLGYPHQVSTNLAIWYSVTAGGNCGSADPDVQCVTLETGVKQLNGVYTITSTDKFSFDFTAGQESGTVTRHERYEQGGCAAGKNVYRTSVFRGIN